MLTLSRLCLQLEAAPRERLASRCKVLEFDVQSTIMNEQECDNTRPTPRIRVCRIPLKFLMRSANTWSTPYITASSTWFRPATLATIPQRMNALSALRCELSLRVTLCSRVKLTFAVAPNRKWYDFLVSGSNPDDPWVPINLKVLTLRGNDNVSSKAGLFYALTGLQPTNQLVANWDLFCRNVAASVRREDCDADYYFIVVKKNRGNEVGRVFWTSLLHIERVTPNGSNPPFQCCWRENTNRVVRPRAESVDTLLDVMLGCTFVLRARALESFMRHILPGMSAEMQQVWAGTN